MGRGTDDDNHDYSEDDEDYEEEEDGLLSWLCLRVSIRRQRIEKTKNKLKP